MDPISFGLGLAGEVRHQVNSIKTRIANFQDGPSSFRSLTCKLDLLVKHMSDVNRLLIAIPNAVPTANSADVNQILADVCDSIKNENWTMPQSLSKPFTGSSSTTVSKSRLHQLTRANKLKSEMSSLETKIDKASDKLLHLSSVLTNELRSKELQTIVVSTMDEQRIDAQENHEALLSKLDNLQIAEAATEEYNPATTSPAPSHTIVLDFDSKDDKGNPATPEGLLMRSVVYGESSEIVTSTTGAIKPAYGVLGMAGVGKTVALQGLGYHKEVKERFRDGVLYMSFGQGATLQTTLNQIAKIMTLTGATTRVENVKSSTCLRDAVDYAVMWFQGKICLYLLDDLWPAENMPPGYFQDLRQLLRGSSQSRMAISTRSVSIASEAGCIVDFRPRNPLGNAAVDMFMSHATGHSAPELPSKVLHDLRPSVSKILTICGGLPIALSVTGCAVSKLVRVYETFEKACDVYAIKLEKKRTLLGSKCTVYGSSLIAAIALSLEYLEVEFSEWKTENSSPLDITIFDMYISLCVLANQACVPISVLGRMWNLEEDDAFDVASLICGMSLATLKVGGPLLGLSDKAGIELHDLQLDFCQQKAVEAKKFSLWHAQLLNRYLDLSSRHVPEEQNREVLGRILDFTPRPWWSEDVPEDGYIHANISRHLRFAGYGIELSALLLQGRWTVLRRKIGGILALETDFEELENVFEQGVRTGDIKRGFQLIFKAVRLSWGRMVKGIRAFQFQVCGRLTKMRKSSAVVNEYLKSIEECTPKPYLLPVSSFFPDVESSLLMEIPVGGECTSVACSPCGQYIVCGAGSDIVIAKTSNGEIVQRTQGLRSNVICVAFAGGSKEIVSGLEDGTVMVWEWELSEYTVRVLKGHFSLVTGVAVNSDGGQIFSSSWDTTVRIWNTSTNAQIYLTFERSGIYCVTVRGEGEMIAFGLRNGTLKVVDGVTKCLLFEDEHFALCAAFSPDGSYLATGSFDKTVRVWNTGTRTRLGGSLEGHEEWVTCVSFSPDGKKIASSSHDGTIRVWDVESGVCAGISPNILSYMESVSFTVDGQRIVSVSWDGIVRIWDAHLEAEAQEIRCGDRREVWGAAISENGLRVASASLDGTVRLWDAQTGEQMGVPLEGHTSRVICVSFSLDERHLVSGSDDKTLRLWDTGMHAQIGDPFVGHTESVLSVSFSVDGLRIISGSADGTVRIWNAETHEQMGKSLQSHAGLSARIHCVSESSDGCHIVSRDDFGIAIIWNRDNRSIVWKSVPRVSGFENKLTVGEAESIIRGCGPQTPHLWPRGAPAYIAELYCSRDSVYSNILGDVTLLADTIATENMSIPCWSYNAGRNVFVAGLRSGAVAVCKLIFGDSLHSNFLADTTWLAHTLTTEKMSIEYLARKSWTEELNGRDVPFSLFNVQEI